MTDLERQFDTATAFFLAGERCALELKFGPYGPHVMSAPVICNYALAVEISLKLLHAIVFDRLESGHSLKSLFEALPDESKANLIYLEDCVDEIDRYFVDWRYPYEKELLFGDIDEPRRAFILCYKEIQRLRPSLKSVYEKEWGDFEPDFWNAWGHDETFALKVSQQ